MKRWELEVAYGKLQRENEALQSQLGAQAVELGRLRELVADQATMIADLKAAVEELRRAGHRQVGRFRRDPERLVKEPKRSGRKAGQGEWSRRGEPTEEQKAQAVTKTSHLDGCPVCQSKLEDLAEHVHYEWDLPPVEPVLTRFISQSGYCATCRTRRRSRHPEQISLATGAAGMVIGPQAKALASDMKHHLGLSYAKVSAFFAVAFSLSVGRSALWRADMRLAARAGPVYRELIGLVRQLAQAHVDETGWRIGTVSAWLWVFCGQGVTLYTIAKSRGHQVVLDILGHDFAGYLTSDGLLTYDAAALASWLKQKCLAHILRHLEALSADQVASHLALAQAGTALLKDAISLARGRDAFEADAYDRAAADLERRLDALIAEHVSDADDDGARTARHLRKHRDHLLGFLYVPGLQPTNNDAERDLRPGVITRKVGACNRSDQGAHAHAVLASISATCRKRRIPVLDFLVDLQRASTSVPSIVQATPA
jgi:transposase